MRYTDHAASEDPTELSFRKGEVLEIVDRSGKWWEGRREDGSMGSEYYLPPFRVLRVRDADCDLAIPSSVVPSNYLRVLE